MTKLRLSTFGGLLSLISLSCPSIKKADQILIKQETIKRYPYEQHLNSATSVLVSIENYESEISFTNSFKINVATDLPTSRLYADGVAPTSDRSHFIFRTTTSIPYLSFYTTCRRSWKGCVINELQRDHQPKAGETELIKAAIHLVGETYLNAAFTIGLSERFSVSYPVLYN